MHRTRTNGTGGSIRRQALLATGLACCLGLGAGGAEAGAGRTLTGVVDGNGEPQAGYEVSLYASELTGRSAVRSLGRDRTDGAGSFSIDYRLPPRSPHAPAIVLYVLAEKGAAMLASAIGTNETVVVNERTTVAIGTAFAQFVDGRDIGGNRWGVQNAVHMAGTMADPATGAVADVLAMSPNGDETSTLRTFNTLANIVASCVADPLDCQRLFEYATPPGGAAPTTVLQALANITKYPARRVDELFDLADNPTHVPVLGVVPTSWLLFIKFTGGFFSAYADDNLLNGPGNVAITERGFAWINDNYVPAADLEVACAGLRLLQFTPWGANVPGSPYFGGGLSGAGFGITIDRRNRVVVGNFGFEAPVCDGSVPPDPARKIPATHDSISIFRMDGSPISGPDGFTEGHIWWPQATVADPTGNVWVANCGNDTVTLIPHGNPRRARNIPLPGGQGALGNFQVRLPDRPLIKPFGLTIDPKGRAWVTGNRADHVPETELPAGRVYRISTKGTVETMPHTDGVHPESILSWPMGISSDRHGNVWVSNSDSVNVPCVTPLDPQDGPRGPSIVLYPADGGFPKRLTGGGLTIPWGNAIDGDDTLWVFNFGQRPTKDVDENTTWPDTPLSRFCGGDPSKCPPRLKTGDPISPDTGYVSDALDRITGGGIDPSGNVWLMNNWKKSGPTPPVYHSNPGGNSFVIVPGAAAPVRTPVLGPPSGFGP